MNAHPAPLDARKSEDLNNMMRPQMEANGYGNIKALTSSLGATKGSEL